MKIQDKHGKEWQLVPVEMTSEMYIAGGGTFRTSYTGTATSTPDRVFHAALSVAPDPELPEGLEPVAWFIGETHYVHASRTCKDAEIYGWKPLVLQSAALKALAEKDKEIAALSYLKNIADQYGLSVFADMEALAAIEKETGA